jgi:hypothetical protein
MLMTGVLCLLFAGFAGAQVLPIYTDEPDPDATDPLKVGSSAVALAGTYVNDVLWYIGNNENRDNPNDPNDVNSVNVVSNEAYSGSSSVRWHLTGSEAGNWWIFWRSDALGATPLDLTNYDYLSFWVKYEPIGEMFPTLPLHVYMLDAMGLADGMSESHRITFRGELVVDKDLNVVSQAPWNGGWQHVQIPFTLFTTTDEATLKALDKQNTPKSGTKYDKSVTRLFQFTTQPATWEKGTQWGMANIYIDDVAFIGPAGPTAVQSESWGVIKALFQR